MKICIIFCFPWTVEDACPYKKKAKVSRLLPQVFSLKKFLRSFFQKATRIPRILTTFKKSLQKIDRTAEFWYNNKDR